MARSIKKKPAPLDPEEKARIKKMRALQRREDRKVNRAAKAEESPTKRPSGGDYTDPTYQRDDFEWIRASTARSYAGRILNDYKEFSYWLSIPHSGGVEPVAHFYPCKFFRREGRVFYGFVFQEHRDRVFINWREDKRARKETTDNVSEARRSS